jgi:feruloyl esterase
MAEHVWVAQAVRKADGSAIPAQKYALIHEAVLQTCDARDGVKDGVLEDPRTCKFNPRQLQCNDASNASCLTRDQVKAAEAIYNPLVDSHTKRQIFPGLMPGSELGWNALAGPDPGPIAITYWRDLVFADPQWNYLTVDVSAATAKADAMHAAAMNAINPDLTEFFQHGGKLVQYHGWNDEQISPLNTVQYYESVVKKLGSASVEHSYRLFMIPGMAHCRGGEGVNSFDSISIIDNWVANANPPAQIPASRVRDGKVEGTRPVCSYPRVAVYKGTGNTDDARNFTCEQR